MKSDQKNTPGGGPGPKRKFKRGGRKGRRTKSMVVIANERIEILFNFAEAERRRGKHDRLNRYIDLARRIGMRYNIRLPAKYKFRYCKHCYSYLNHGRTADTRIRNKFLILHCRSCGKITRKAIQSKKMIEE